MTNKPSIAELQRCRAALGEHLEEVSWQAQELHEASPVLLEIVAAALAWQEARASIADAYLRCPVGPSKESQQRWAEAAAGLLAALAKVRP